MACRYYDEVITAKLQKWLPSNSTLRVLKPDESKRLFELAANDSKDSSLKLPFIALSRNNDIELLSTVKSPKSFDGLRLWNKKTGVGGAKLSDIPATTAQLNVIPIKLLYQLDIYTKTAEEGDEYIRSFLFKLINNPVIKIEIPYNDLGIEHIANIRVMSSISDTSAISERLFSGQFTRWTLQFEVQDAFLFSIPYRRNWILYVDENTTVETSSELELYNDKEQLESTELLNFSLKQSQ